MKVSSSLIAAVLLAGGLIYQYDANKDLQAELTAQENRNVALQQENASLENNLTAMRSQLMNLANSLQEAREQLGATTPLRTDNDLATQLHGKQPPPGSSTAIRPPSSNQDMGLQMARMQANSRYGEFIASMPGTEADKNQASEVIAKVFVERIQISQARSSGRAGAADLERVGSPEYLREKLEMLLNSEQMAVYDDYESSFQAKQLRNGFAQDINRFAPALNEPSRELVLDALTRHLGTNLRSGQNGNADAVSDTQRQLVALGDARAEILPQLDEEQGYEAEKLLTRIRSAMVQSQAMNDGTDSQ